MNSRTPNALIHESSPYLLQHAHNPVRWEPWSEAAFERAGAGDKLVIVSIGYSTCHWCHVMEHESFENEHTAALMNEFFVNIKVDREERPDIDAVYMQAVQLMTGHGGWPLNVILLPDKRAIYGGTYFPQKKWNDVLQMLQKLWMEDRAQVLTYAENLLGGMQQSSLLLEPVKEVQEMAVYLQNGLEKDHAYRDTVHGGTEGAPKFPMPVNYLFRLDAALLEKDSDLEKHVAHTLRMMALGGIYDQVAGGFFRYATDAYWKVPHFEKMLYDNAQLLQLYARAYRFTKQQEYRNVCEETFGFLLRNMRSAEGGFYAALDADSEGEEGKYYVYTLDELNEASGGELETVQEIYEINPEGYWEDGKYILLRSLLNTVPPERLPAREAARERINAKLLAWRNQRVPPSTDTKRLSSWNALLASAFAEYYHSFGDPQCKAELQSLLNFLLEQCCEGNTVYRSNERKIPGMLEDYALLVQALTDAATVLPDAPALLTKARDICAQALERFGRSENGFFAFAAETASELVTPVYEIQDNVMPSGNAVMADNLYRLAHIFGLPAWEEQALQMLQQVMPSFARFPGAYSRWAALALRVKHGYIQKVVAGPDVAVKAETLYRNAEPHSDVFYVTSPSELPLFEGRFHPGKNLLYTCRGHECDLPQDI